MIYKHCSNCNKQINSENTEEYKIIEGKCYCNECAEAKESGIALDKLLNSKTFADANKKRREDLKIRWLKFLYVFFAIQSVLIAVSTAISIKDVVDYFSWHSSAYGLNKIFVVLIIINVIRLIVKIVACTKQYTEIGFKCLSASFYLDALYGIINGFAYSIISGLITIAIWTAIVIPNLVYINKREYMFY